MIITYGASLFQGQQSFIPYPDAMACGEAIMPVADSLRPTFPELMVQCKETDLMSSSLRPKPRPEGLGL
jgi:hypothetical protein